MVKTTIDKRGVVTTPGEGVIVSGHANNAGFSPFSMQGSLDSADAVLTEAFEATLPGFYLVSGSTETTGTLPAASTFPGSMMMFGRALNSSGPFMLTGSRVDGADGCFYFSGSYADALSVEPGGVNLWSDGNLWVVQAAVGALSGTLSE